MHAEREYFAAEDDEDLLVKQLRFYTRFVTVCLLLGKRDEVWDHLDKLKELVEEFRKEAQVQHESTMQRIPFRKAPDIVHYLDR